MMRVNETENNCYISCHVSHDVSLTKKKEEDTQLHSGALIHVQVCPLFDETRTPVRIAASEHENR